MVTILLGDDSEDVTSTLKDYLEIMGSLEIEVFKTGEDLIERARTGNYDGVITDFDYGVGRINGLEVVARIREFDQTNPIYLHTGEPDAKRRYGSTSGLTGVICKSLSAANEIIELF
jgi:CheY-like chemotaxis protein